MRTYWSGWRGRLPGLAFALVAKFVPIACVDILPYRVSNDLIEIGLIQRKDAYGKIVWNLVGGGIHRRESVAEAAARHIHTTLGEDVRWEEPDYSHPEAIGEYSPVRGDAAGFDPRKHAIALTYVVPLTGEISARGEALDFRWFSEDTLPVGEMGFGQDDVIRLLFPIKPSNRQC